MEHVPPVAQVDPAECNGVFGVDTPVTVSPFTNPVTVKVSVKPSAVLVNGVRLGDTNCVTVIVSAGRIVMVSYAVEAL